MTTEKTQVSLFKIKSLIESGMKRPEVAKELGINLAQLKQVMESPQAVEAGINKLRAKRESKFEIVNDLKPSQESN